MSVKFLEQPEGKIAYEDTGAGPLVVCVPSLGDVRGEYRFLVPQLVQAGYRVVSIDPRGLGESSPRWNDFSVTGIGEDLVALIRALDAGPAVIIGDSMGGGAAVWAAAESIDWVAGLVLVDPFVHGDGSPLLSLVFRLLLARPWGPAMWQRYYSSLYPTRKPQDFAQYVAALRKNLSEPGRIEATSAMMRTSKMASEVRLPAVKSPVLVIMGSKDPDFKDPEAEGRWVAEHTNGKLVMIPGAGHYPHAEMPEVTGPVIVDFLRSVKESQGQAYAAS